MRFLIGMLGGLISAALVVLIVAGVSILLGQEAMQPFKLASMVLLAVEEEAADGLTGIFIYLCAGTILGGLFTSVMCGRVATGPAIGIGLVYGFGIYFMLRFILLPFFIPEVARDTAVLALLGRSLLFGGLMGAWVIVASHMWPRFSIKCD